MATPNKFAIREVALATFFDIATGKAILHLDTLKTSGVSNTAETVYSTGGRGNSRLVGFSGSREASITLQDAVFDTQAIAMMTGNDLAEGAVTIYKRDVVKVNNDSATLDKTPIDGTLISLYRLNADGSHGEELTEVASSPSEGQYTITGNSLSFSLDALPDGTDLVAYYRVETADDAKTIRVTADSFAGSYKLVLDCIVRDLATKNDYAAQIIVPNVKMEDDWEFSLSSDSEPSVLDLPLQVLRDPASNRFWEMVVYDESQIQ